MTNLAEVSSSTAATSRLRGRSVLLAMDGSEGALAGARTADALAAQRGAIVHVVSIIDTRSVPFPPALDIALAVEDPGADRTMHQAQVQDVRASLATATGHAVDWPVHVVLGTPASAIVDEARRLDAALVIVGLRKHGRIDRALNNETSLDVMRNCSCPVLGVVPGMPSLPVRVLAATDFSDISFRAMRMAREVAGHGALFMLAYAPPIAALLDEEGERLIHDLGVRGAFAKAIRNLGDDGITFDHVVLEHDIHETTAATLLAYAEQSKCDLVTAGSARLGRIERWMIGSVSTELIRDGSRSVLIVPPERTSQRS